MSQEEQIFEVDILEHLITKLTLFNYPTKNCPPVPLTEDEVWYIVDRVTPELQQCNALLEIDVPVMICGDTHGQFSDVIRIFQTCGWPNEMRYLFLGDYVDRGPNSVETVCLMFLFKMRYPNSFFLLRGNHESKWVNQVYGFYDECKDRYSVKLYNHFQKAFNSLPIASLVSDRLFCMHGGLSPDLYSFDQLRNMRLPFTAPNAEGLVSDILWSDPSPYHNGWKKNSRGISLTFGEDVVHSFCDKFNVDMICRAHQVVQDGFDFFAQRKLITIFSAPNYCGEFHNKAAMMFVGKDMRCRLRQLNPAKKKAGAAPRSRSRSRSRSKSR